MLYFWWSFRRNLNLITSQWNGIWLELIIDPAIGALVRDRFSCFVFVIVFRFFSASDTAPMMRCDSWVLNETLTSSWDERLRCCYSASHLFVLLLLLLRYPRCSPPHATNPSDARRMFVKHSVCIQYIHSTLVVIIRLSVTHTSQKIPFVIPCRKRRYSWDSCLGFQLPSLDFLCASLPLPDKYCFAANLVFFRSVFPDRARSWNSGVRTRGWKDGL